MTESSENALPSVITIDPPMSTDLDDAVNATPQPDGSWVVDVCIADVTTDVKLNSAADRVAQQRGYTEYRNGSIAKSMLPHDTTMALSLLRKQMRPMVWIQITLDPSLKPTNVTYQRIYAATQARMSYEEVDLVLVNPMHVRYQNVMDMWELTSQLFALRQARTGAVWDPDLGLGTTDDGQLYQLRHSEKHRSHLIIQELMVLTNNVLALHAVEKGLALMFRNHIPRNLTENARNMAVADIREAAKRGPMELANAMQQYNMRVGPAEIGLTARGHWGLGLTAYAWFTSPLRRYTDIVNLRLLLDGEVHPDVEKLAAHLTEEFRRKKRAEQKRTYDSTVEKAAELVKQLKLSALRVLPFTVVIEACRSVEFISINLEAELQLRIEKQELLMEDITMVLQEARAYFSTAAVQAVQDYILVDKHRLWRLVNYLRNEQVLPALSSFMLNQLTMGAVAELLKEHFDLPLDISTIKSPNKLFWGENKKETKKKSVTKSSEPKKHSLKIGANPKSKLMERIVKWGGQYFADTRHEGTDNNRTFIVTVTWKKGDEIFGKAEASDSYIKGAEQAACRLILEAVVPTLPNTPAIRSEIVHASRVTLQPVPPGQPLNMLNQRIVQRGGSLCATVMPHPEDRGKNPIFQAKLTVVWKGRNYVATGSGRQKIHAQNVAAQDILNQIKAANQMPAEEKAASKPAKIMNSRMLINERKMTQGGVITYGEATADNGTPILWTLTATYAEAGTIYTALGAASSIKAAQDKAVGNILEQLPALENQPIMED